MKVMNSPGPGTTEELSSKTKNPLLMKIEFLTSLYRITLDLVTEWNLDPDNSRKYFFF